MMPTLTRYLRTLALAAGLVVGAMLALAHLVEPRTRPMSEPLDARVIRDAGGVAATAGEEGEAAAGDGGAAP